MIQLENFVHEKLKISKKINYGVKTTLRKFIAWYTGEDEYRINRYNLEDRNFKSSDKNMSKGDINDLLYKHINDTIYISEEPIRTISTHGLNSTSTSKLYEYSFDIDGITFSIDARIYNDNELLSNDPKYIITEKLKISKKIDDKIRATLGDFMRWFFRDKDGSGWTQYDLEIFDFGDVCAKHFGHNFGKLYNFIDDHLDDDIRIEEIINHKQARWGHWNIGTYKFDINGINFVVDSPYTDDEESFSKYIENM